MRQRWLRGLKSYRPWRWKHRRKWPPDFLISFETDDDDAVERERLAISHFSDEELLGTIASACREILLLADPVRLHMQFSDDVWELEEIVPLNPDLQAFLLWHLAAEALGLATFALEQRASATALGQVRIICDAYCLLRWLKEPRDEPERKARTVGLMLSELDDEKKVIRSLPRTPEQTASRQQQVQELTEFQASLEEAAHADGIVPERPPATAAELYQTYFTPGYRVYRILSDIGGHVGLRFVGEFFRESGSSMHDFDFVNGALRQRSFWLAAGYSTFAALAEVIAWNFKWERGMRAEVVSHFRNHRGLLVEVQRRYDEHWLGTTESDQDLTKRPEGI